MLSPDGRFIRRVRLGQDEPLTALPDGSYLIARHHDAPWERPGTVRNEITVYRLTADGDSSAPFARYVSSFTTVAPGSGRRLREVPRPFDPVRFAHGSSTGFVSCDAEAFRCDVWNSSGTMVRSVRLRAMPVPITDGDVDEWRATQLARRTGPARAEFERESAGIQRPPTFPFFSTFRVDAADRIWIREYTWREGDVADDWLVLAPDGSVLGRVAMPRFNRLLRIGADHVLGLEIAESGEESVVLFPHAPVRGERDP